MTPPRTILVHEYVTGGGYAALPQVPSLGAEGEIMLRSVLADFRSVDAARIVTTRDSRLRSSPLDADETVPLSPDGYTEGFGALLGRVDDVLVIAPEEHGILASLSDQVLAAGAKLLGSLPEGVRAAGDKWVCHTRLQAAGLPMPQTCLADPGQARETALALGLPVVLKTIDGQGSLGVCLATDTPSLEAALRLLGQDQKLLVQRYHAGLHASVSLLVAAKGVLPLCANGQDMLPGIPFSYQGGTTPLPDPSAAGAMALAAVAAEVIPGLRGFVGVDLVFDGRQWRIIEVNPRVTVAYAGVRQIIDCNLAQAIVRACLDNELPERVTLSGQVAFGKKRGTP